MNSPAFTQHSKNIMTHYEFTRIRGIRLQQLEDNCAPFVETKGNETYAEIFDKEVLENKLPFIIERKHNNKTEFFKASEMVIRPNKY
jgi:DNA-directed RNA polymerase subunit K/omega